MSVWSPLPYPGGDDGIGSSGHPLTPQEIRVVGSRPEGSSSVYKASFNFINSIVGAGIIGMPFAMGECGLVGGTILMVCVAVLVGRSVTMLIECGVREGHLDYEDLAMHLLGKAGYYSALMSMFLFAFGAQVAYLIIIGDTIPMLTNANREIVIGMVALFVVLPLCLLKDMSHLSYTSLAAILFDLIIILIVVSVAPDAARRQDISPSLTDGTGTLAYFSPRLFAGIGTLSFAFVCMHNSFIVYRSLRDRTEQNWRKVAYGSVAFCLCIAMTFGLSGYLAFGNQVQGDVLNNFILPRVSIDWARGLLATCMIFVYPMEMFVSRHCAISLMKELQVLTLESPSEGAGDCGGDEEVSAVGSPIRGDRERVRTEEEEKREEERQAYELDSKGRPKNDSIEDSQRRLAASLARDEDEDDGEPHFGGAGRAQDDEALGARAALMREQFWGISRQLLNSQGGAALGRHWGDVLAVHTELAFESAAHFLSKKENRVHVAVTLLLWVVTVMLALSFDDLGVVLALTGAVAASCLGYILPALIYIKSYWQEMQAALGAVDKSSSAYEPSLTGQLMAFRQFWMPFFMIMFGALACLLGIATVFSDRE
jgi:amino acid permease